MIETSKYRYTITVTYVDNANEAFNPSFLGSFLIDRQYVTDCAFWKLELQDVCNDMFRKKHCIACMVKVFDNDYMNINDAITEYYITHNNGKLYFNQF